MSMSTPINQIRTMAAITQPGPLNPPTYDPTPPQANNMQQPPADFSMGMMPGGDMQQQQQQPNQLVEDILREFEEPPGGNYQQDISAAGMNYAMDPVHIPPAKNPQAAHQLQSEETRVPSATAPGNMSLAMEDMNSGSGSSSGGMFGKFGWLVDAIKPLVAVFVIVFLLSLHQVNRYIFTLFPQLLLENGQLSVYGILLRALIATVLFYLATTFL